MPQYQVIIGLETHIQLNTVTKLFCSCKNEYAPHQPNANICEFCTGQPGALPVLNRAAVEKAIQLGVALSATIPEITHWDRKNYFYPDLPSGYQISQYDEPIVQGGTISFYIENKENGVFEPSQVQITRAHLECDAAKLIHAGGKTMVDFNRSGCPLIEIVTEPVIYSKEQAMAYVNEMQLLVRTLGISDADMEKGQMRFDCNISLQNEQEQIQNKLPGYRSEIKNINSVRALGRAIEYEMSRQKELLDTGILPDQETRGWDDDKGVSTSQRSKEDAMDYRYFPDPDVLPLSIARSDIPDLTTLNELPSTRRERYLSAGLPMQIANIFVEKPEVGSLFDAANSHAAQSLTKTIAHIISGNILSLHESHPDTSFASLITPQDIATLAQLFQAEKINNKGLATALEQLAQNQNMSVDEILEKNSLLQLNDDTVLQAFVDAVIASNPIQVEQYRAGKDQVIGFLVGQCMKESHGKGNPQKFGDLLKSSL
jgi:aspartyl-tRNA(Asn)/glutamyl-tRNA(Gln) amidotransferase subunit B